MALTTLGLGRNGKKRVASSAVALGLLAALMLFLSGLYSFLLAPLFAPLGALDLLLAVMTAMAVVFPFVFIMYAAQSMVFSAGDADLVLSLPLSAFAVLLARVLALYLQALFMVELMLLPAGAAYLWYGGAGGVLFLLRLVLLGAAMALLPTLAALLFGALISLIVARLRFKNLFNVLFSLLLAAGLVVLVFSAGGGPAVAGDAASTLDAEALRGALFGALPPLGWAVRGMLGNMGNFLLVAAVCVLPFLALVWVLSLGYKPLLTHLASHYLRTDYKLRGVKASGWFAALFYKEARRFFGTPAYLLNCGIGLVMMLVAAVAAVVNKNAVADMLGQVVGMGGSEVLQLLPPVLLVVIGALLGMVYTSAVSISLEGPHLWILKEAPLGIGQIFAAKAGFNFALAGGGALLAVGLLAFAFNLPPADAVWMAVLCCLYALLLSLGGLFVNLLLPRLDAENDTIIVKQSASVMVMLVLDVVVVGGGVGLFLLTRPLGFRLFAAIMAGALVLLCAAAVLGLATVGRRRFAAL